MKNQSPQSSNRIRVTHREKVLLDLIFEGLNRNQIAQRLGCTRNNINQTIYTLCKKYPQLKIRLWKKKYTEIEIPSKYIDKQPFNIKGDIKGGDVSPSNTDTNNLYYNTTKNDNFVEDDGEGLE